jgi:hypothetical protein
MYINKSWKILKVAVSYFKALSQYLSIVTNENQEKKISQDS